MICQERGSILTRQSLFTRLRRELRLLRDAPPGQRFARRHKRMLARDRPLWLRIARIVGSGMVAVAGVTLLALPGPGLLVVILGLAMLGGEFALVARRLDALELRLRRWWSAAPRAWSGAGWPLRTTLIAVALVIAGAIGVGVWRLVFA